MNGFFNILKPPGMSSAAVVAVMRRLTGEKRTGHAGTLDPEAAGVLPIMTGKAARLFDYLVDKEKEYEAVCAFGTSTDTQDAAGTVLETSTNYPDIEAVREKVHLLTGEIRQRPSMYSAIKVGGKPLYARARRGEDVEVPERTVTVKSIEITGEEPDHGIALRIRCGRGTYPPCPAGDGLPFVCSWTKDGVHRNHGNCTFEDHNDFAKCVEVFMGDKKE